MTNCCAGAGSSCPCGSSTACHGSEDNKGFVPGRVVVSLNPESQGHGIITQVDDGKLKIWWTDGSTCFEYNMSVAVSDHYIELA